MERPPFRFGAPVEPPWFCDREQELAALTARMADGIHVVLLSPRRYGKTSLLHRASARLRAQGGCAGYANLLFCTTEADVATVVLSAVLSGVVGGRRRAGHALEEVARRLRVSPTFSVAQDGRVTVGFEGTVASRSWMTVLEDALGLLERTAAKRPAALVLDEFQVVARIGQGMGGAFKAVADQVSHASLVFSGSHLSVMEAMTKGSGAPLHGMGERIVLDVVPEPAMTGYLQRRSRRAGKEMTRAVAERVYVLADGVPNYVQQLAYAAYEVAGSADVVTGSDVEAGADLVVERQTGDFAERYERLASSQRRILGVLAAEPTTHVYAEAFLTQVGVANANAVTTALRVLEDRELVSRRAGQWQVADPFLRRWLARR